MFAYKLPEVWMDVRTADGIHSFRLTTQSAASGFLLSPMLQEKDQFGSLMTQGPFVETSGRHVQAVRFRTAMISQTHFLNACIQVDVEEVQVHQASPNVAVRP